MKINKLKAMAIASAVGAILLTSSSTYAMRETTYVITYYSDATLTGQPVGYRSISCNSNTHLDGVTSPYSQIEAEVTCYDHTYGWWAFDWLNPPSWDWNVPK